jgi:CubicO group peptidase (beta-lactamase class C family)
LIDGSACRLVMKFTSEAYMNKIFFGLLTALLALGMAGCASSSGGRKVSDPSGRFSFQVGPELTPLAGDDTFYHYRLEGHGIDAVVTAQPARIEEEGIEQTLRRIGVDPAPLVLDGSTSFGDWQARRLVDSGKDLVAAIAFQMRGDVVYSLVVTGTAASLPGDPPAGVMRLLGSFTFAEAAGRISVPATREDLEALVRRSAEVRGGSISLAAIRDGTIIYRYSTGAGRGNEQTSPDTAYHWGSMTKVVTAVAVIQLAQRRLVDLKAPIARYLPVFPKELGIRVIDLLNHSSGLPDRETDHLIAYANHALPPLEGILAEYLARVDSLDFAPGTQSQYCNWNYLALGVLVEHVTGKPYASYVAESILGPSGMGNTAFRHADLPQRILLASSIISSRREAALLAVLNENLPERDSEKVISARSGDFTTLADFDILAPWGGLAGTADDAARFLWTNIDSNAAQAQWGLSRATLDAMQRMQKSTDGRPLGRGIGWVLRQEKGENVLEHAGGGPGISTLMRLYPKRRLGVVVMGNINDYGAARIVSAAAGILSGQGR